MNGNERVAPSIGSKSLLHKHTKYLLSKICTMRFDNNFDKGTCILFLMNHKRNVCLPNRCEINKMLTWRLFGELYTQPTKWRHLRIKHFFL